MQVLPIIVSFVLSLVFVLLIRRFSISRGLLVKPRDDRWHRDPVPSFGGVSIFLSFIISIVIVSWLNDGFGQLQWGLLAGSGLIFLLGLIDDYIEIPPPAKLIGQILAASVVVIFGYTTSFFTPRIPNSLVAQIPNIFITIVWLVGITNAINLLDNMDGLAGGISLIAALILSYFFWSGGNFSLAVISLSLAGSILGFLIFNFPPASIFMGDSGSLFLGFTLAVMAIAREPQASNVFAVMGVPSLLFLLPILDTTLVTITRLLRGQSPAEGGRDHTSHRLIAFGLSERQAVLVLYGVALVSGVVAIVLESLDYSLSLILVPLLVLTLALVTAYLGRLKVIVSPSADKSRTLNRLMADLAYRRRLMEIVLDFILIAIALYLSFWIRFGLTMDAQNLELFLHTLPITFAGAYLSFYIFGVYKGVWKYISVDELLRYITAAIGGGLFVYGADRIILPPGEISPVVLLLFVVFLFFGLAASRSSFRILDNISGQRLKSREERVIVYGAGDMGEIAVRWMLMNPNLGYRPIGFLDEDPYKVGRQIHNVSILGDIHKLESILKDKMVDGVVVTPSGELSPQDDVEKIISICQTRDVWVRTLRLDFELVD